MENVVKPKEKEVTSNRTRKIFSMIKNKENPQNLIEASLTLSTSEMAKTLLNYRREEELARDKSIMQSRFLTRLL